MEDQKLNHYWAKSVKAAYWSKADGIALPVLGVFLFGYLSWHGYKMKLILVMILTVPITLICLIMLIADLYLSKLDADVSNSTNEESDEG